MEAWVGVEAWVSVEAWVRVGSGWVQWSGLGPGLGCEGREVPVVVERPEQHTHHLEGGAGAGVGELLVGMVTW